MVPIHTFKMALVSLCSWSVLRNLQAIGSARFRAAGFSLTWHVVEMKPLELTSPSAKNNILSCTVLGGFPATLKLASWQWCSCRRGQVNQLCFHCSLSRWGSCAAPTLVITVAERLHSTGQPAAETTCSSSMKGILKQHVSFKWSLPCLQMSHSKKLN